MRGVEIVLPPVVAADGLAGGHEPGPVEGEGVAFGRVELAAVLGQLRCGDLPVGAEAGEFGAPSPPARTNCAWWGSPRHHGDAWGCGGDGGEHDLGVGSCDLGHLVEDDHGTGREGGAVEGEAGDGHGRDPGLAEERGAELLDGLDMEAPGTEGGDLLDDVGLVGQPCRSPPGGLAAVMDGV